MKGNKQVWSRKKRRKIPSIGSTKKLETHRPLPIKILVSQKSQQKLLVARYSFHAKLQLPR